MIAEKSEESSNLFIALIEKVDTCLEKLISEHEIVEPLRAAVNYSVFPGGKRVRPLFALALCSDLGGESDKLLKATCALELLHCSSLVHDDLPCMDDDDYRRGKPSCHKAFDEATAVLVGDFLVGLAMNSLFYSGYSEKISNYMVRELSLTYIKLCNGQQLDMLSDRSELDLIRLHSLKTGALFASACYFGALGAGVSDKTCNLARDLGELIGISFQIADDVIDQLGQTKGRPAGSDQKNNKVTYLASKSSGSSEAELDRINSEIDRHFSLIADQSELKDRSFSLTRSLIKGIFDQVQGDK